MEQSYDSRYSWITESIMEIYREAASLCEFREGMSRMYVPLRKTPPRKAVRRVPVATVILGDGKKGPVLEETIYLN